jgi:ribonuclease BN (tRNA processing enzyme)
VALLAGPATLALGEVVAVEAERIRLRAPPCARAPDALLVRDVKRNATGLLETAEPFAAERLDYLPPPDIMPYAGVSGGPRLVGRVGVLDVALVNGVFGDPLLHARLRHQARSLLFDLGEGGRLPARLAHQVTDVFISHAHLDHLGGFLWLLRSRIDHLPVCRLYGPPGLARHIEGFIQGVLWDRVGDRGPRFEIAELHGDRLRRFRLQAGYPGVVSLGETVATDGVILAEAGFRVRAMALDHHTPVLAYAFEPEREFQVRKDRLAARGWAPGPWLGELKARLRAGEGEARIALPDGGTASAGALGAELILISPGKTLVYATDLADTPDNRRRLAALARGAHTLFCEAMFLEADRDHAERHGHLTARACGEIAAEAAVARLVPFHFSRRYEDDPQPLFDELREACAQVVMPASWTLFQIPAAGDDSDQEE